MSSLNLIKMFSVEELRRNNMAVGTTNAKRQIRTRSTVYSFHILELHGRLGLDLVGFLRFYKPILAYASSTWKLPKKVRVLIEDLRQSDNLGCRFEVEAESYFDLRLDLNNLHELELTCKDETQFRGLILHIFLHECAHFKTKNEKQVESMVLDLIKSFGKVGGE